MATGDRWRRYWFSAGGQNSAAAVRIGVGLSALWMLYQLRNYGSGIEARAGFRPLGILRLLPFEPGAGLLQLCWLTAVASSIAMVIGLRARIATAVSAASTLVIASHVYSFSDHWSHDLNPTLLAQLALLGAHTSDVWSVDAWWRGRHGGPTPVARVYLWSPRLVQASLAIMMASAGVSKLLAGKLTLAWALSDNLRHQIMVRFDLAGVPRTELAEWILADPLRWKATAVLNLVAQLAPLVAVVAIQRPWIRAACGVIFCTEVLGLWLVMGFWDPWWFPLVAAFVDWDRVVTWWRARRGYVFSHAPGAPPPVGRATTAFVAGYLALYVVVAFWHWPLIDQRLGLYPFTAYPMFASIRAAPPYDTHQRYELLRTASVIDSSVQHSRSRPLVRDERALRAELELLVQAAASSGASFSTVRITIEALRAEPHPALPRFDRVELATVGVLSREGAFTHRLTRLDRVGAHALATGLPPDATRFALYRGGQLSEITAARAGERVLFALPSGAWLLLAWDRDRWFVVAESRQRG